jgi:protoporphyrin/coproporphyrin ferrochelatase
VSRFIDQTSAAPASIQGETTDQAGRRVGVLLLNLGGPDTQEAVEPFLTALFSDREIIQLPGGARLQPALARFIARMRRSKVRANYRSIGGGSPILALTRRQAAALEVELNHAPDRTAPGRAMPTPGARFRVGAAMRYWHPTAAETLSEMWEEGIRRVIALTLYPHFSAATTGSSLNDLNRTAAAMAAPPGEAWKITAIDRYPVHPGYLEALAATVREGLDSFPAEARDQVVLLFSAHGLPESFILRGDPYVGEIGQTREALLRLLRARGIQNPWKQGYQSRTGPVKWTGPYTDRVIEELAGQGVNAILVVPLSFVSDHIETLYEVDQLFADLARRRGITEFRRTRMLNDDPLFVAALADLVQRHLEETGP